LAEPVLALSRNRERTLNKPKPVVTGMNKFQPAKTEIISRDIKLKSHCLNIDDNPDPKKDDYILMGLVHAQLKENRRKNT